MNVQLKSPTYFFISDLHIGGDGKLNFCHFEGELIQFLKEIGQHPGPVELIIIGDCFGLWEMQSTPVEEKILRLTETHPLLFHQLRQTGEKLRITLLPGNHDHEMTWATSYPEQLRNYNIHLQPTESLTREIGGRRLWIEHGNQHDPFNRFEEFGSRVATPLGYFIVAEVAARAGRLSKNSKNEWIQDLESVYPNEDIPLWLLSNYFFKELTPLLRWIVFPFLLLFSLSLFIVAGMKLERLGMLQTNIFQQRLGEIIGFPGKVVDLILVVNEVVILLMVALSVPIILIILDFRRTLRAYGVDTENSLKLTKDHHFVKAAQDVFNSHPDVAVYLYGHSHIPSLTKIEDRFIINTGTWLKRLVRTQPFTGLFPPIFVGCYHLNYFKIEETEDGDIRINYRQIPKALKNELTIMERLLILGRNRKDLQTIPNETIIQGAKKRLTRKSA